VLAEMPCLASVNAEPKPDEWRDRQNGPELE